MSKLTVATLLFLGVVAGFLVWVRIAPSDPQRWHVDPQSAARPRSPNWAIAAPGEKHEAPVYRLAAGDLARAFDAFAAARPRTMRLAGTPEDGLMTYIVRSARIGYPDYVSVAFIDLGEGRSTLALFSRSHFGYGDQGVNRHRLAEWLKDFAPA